MFELCLPFPSPPVLLHTFPGDLAPASPLRVFLCRKAVLNSGPPVLIQWQDVADRCETRIRAVTAGKSKGHRTDGKRLVSRHAVAWKASCVKGEEATSSHLAHSKPTVQTETATGMLLVTEILHY